MRVGRTRRLGGLLAVLVLAAGCGGDDDGGDAAGSGPGDDPRTEAERQADVDTAGTILLTLGDFPAGWEEEPAESDEDDQALQDDMAECLDVDPALLADDDPQAKSPSFVAPSEEEVSAEVTLTASAEDTTRTLDLMKDDATPGCYADAVKAAMAQSTLEGGQATAGVEFGEPTFNPVSFPGMGDDSVAMRLTVPLSAQGVDVDVHVDVVMVRVGRVGISGTFLSTFSPFDSTEAARLMQLMVDRVPAAEAG